MTKACGEDMTTHPIFDDGTAELRSDCAVKAAALSDDALHDELAFEVPEPLVGEAMARIKLRRRLLEQEQEFARKMRADNDVDAAGKPLVVRMAVEDIGLADPQALEAHLTAAV